MSIWIQSNNGQHSSIRMSPKERYLKDFDSLRFMEKSILEEGFLHRITRKVTPTATISLYNVSYEVPQVYIGRTVHLRYRPENMSEVYIELELVSGILGHASTQTTKVYAKPSLEMIKAAMDNSISCPEPEEPLWSDGEDELAKLFGLR